MTTATVDPTDRIIATVQGGPYFLVNVLKWALACSAIAIVGVSWALVHQSRIAATNVPLVWKEHADGRVEVARYDTATDGASEESVKFYLRLFAGRHYRRFRVDLAKEYPLSRPFLSPEVQKQEEDSESAGKDVLAFAADPRRDDIDVQVETVVLLEQEFDQHRRRLGGKAQVRFTRETLARMTREVTDSKPLVATIHYQLPEHLPSDVVEANPIGIQITYLRVD